MQIIMSEIKEVNMIFRFSDLKNPTIGFYGLIITVTGADVQAKFGKNYEEDLEEIRLKVIHCFGFKERRIKKKNFLEGFYNFRHKICAPTKKMPQKNGRLKKNFENFIKLMNLYFVN